MTYLVFITLYHCWACRVQSKRSWQGQFKTIFSKSLWFAIHTSFHHSRPCKSSLISSAIYLWYVCVWLLT